MIVWKNKMNNILDEKKENIYCIEIGNDILQNIYDTISNLMIIIKI